MALFSVENVAIAGVSAAVPKTIEDNLSYTNLSEKEREFFVKTVGIRYRRIAPKGTTAADLCLASASELIAKLAWQPSDISILVFVSQTPDYQIPFTACTLQHKLGLPKNCIAFDINLGCSGYVYGLSIVGALLSKMKEAKALMLVGDCSSSCISSLDKSVAPLFSDAGSATALAYQEGKKMDFNLQTDGSEFDAIIIPDGGMRKPFSSNSFLYKEIEKGIQRTDAQMILDGMRIFNFALREVPKNIDALCDFSKLQKERVDWLILHQANKLIIDTVRKKVALPEDITPSSLFDYGNTSSASIPLTMVVCTSDFKPKTHSILVGFGVGLSWGSALVDLSDCVFLPLVEV